MFISAITCKRFFVDPTNLVLRTSAIPWDHVKYDSILEYGLALVAVRRLIQTIPIYR
jgi:hypothetical protein